MRKHHLSESITLVFCLLFVACQDSRLRTRAAAPLPSAPGPQIDSAFWKQWGDGLAEVCAYSLRYPRYGNVRNGSAVMIFVAETFSNSARVKADPGKHPPSDQFPVMKLNFVQDFQTGIYGYHTMLSSFVALQPLNGRPTGSLAKAAFSSQEWCGQLWHQLIPEAGRIRQTQHSYFDGEADLEGMLDYPAEAMSEDALFLWARGMAWPVVEPGRQKEVVMLTSLETARLRHVPLAWNSATLHRAPRAERIYSPAGHFDVQMRTITWSGGRRMKIGVEDAPPHRIIRWEDSSGWRGEFTGSKRLKYWEITMPGGESQLRDLGLSPIPGASAGKAN